MLRLTKINPFSLAVVVLALTILACSVFTPKSVPITTLVPTTKTPTPSFTPTISSTPSPSITPSPRPTLTSTPQPKWVADFAQPILDVIALRTPDFQDDFDDKSGRWQTDRCGQRMEFIDGELVLTDCRAYRANMNYADFVAEFDARFLPDSNKRSSWQFIFRRFDAAFTHFAVNYDGSVAIIDLINREHLEFPSIANRGLETNHLLVIAKGSQFSFYINNKPFNYLMSPSVSLQGDILLGNTDGSGSIDLAHPAIVAYDNFKIWNIHDISIP
jgi:hypothetical protein